MKKATIFVLIAVALMAVVLVVTMLGQKNEMNNKFAQQSIIQQEQAEKLQASENTRTALEETISSLTAEKDELGRQIADLQSSLLAAQAAVDSSVQQLEAAKAEYQQKLDASQKEIEMLSGVQQELNNQIAAQKSVAQQELDSARSALEQELETAKVALEEAKAAETEAVKRAEETNAALMTAQTDLIQLKAMLETAEAEKAQLQGQLSTAESDADQLREDLATAEAIAQEAQLVSVNSPDLAPIATDQQTGNAEQQIARLKADNMALNEALSSLQAKVSEQEQLIQSLQSAAQVQPDDAGAQAASVSDAEVAALRSEKEQLQGEYEALQSMLLPLQAEAEGLRAENGRLTEQVNLLAAQLESASAAQPAQETRGTAERNDQRVAKLLITCENKYGKKTYLKVAPEEALELKLPTGTTLIRVQLVDQFGNEIVPTEP